MGNGMKNAMIFTALALVLAACNVPFLAKPTPTSTLTPTASNTPEPTLTLTPTASSTPESTMTFTPTASTTPIPTLSIPTFFFILPSVTPAPRALDCQLESESIAYETHFNPGESFTAGWNITNTGSATWFPGTIVLQYVAGTRMYKNPVVALQKSAAPGDTASFTADLRAPQGSSDYTAFWALRQGDTFFCRVSVTISVP